MLICGHIAVLTDAHNEVLVPSIDTYLEEMKAGFEIILAQQTNIENWWC